jgi:hypothetical protein
VMSCCMTRGTDENKVLQFLNTCIAGMRNFTNKIILQHRLRLA